MLAAGEPDFEPFTYISAPARVGSVTWAFSHRSGGGRDMCQAADDLEDDAGDADIVLSGGVDRNGRLIQRAMPAASFGPRQRRAY